MTDADCKHGYDETVSKGEEQSIGGARVDARKTVDGREVIGVGSVPQT